MTNRSSSLRSASTSRGALFGPSASYSSASPDRYSLHEYGLTRTVLRPICAASQTHTRHVHAATPAALPPACCGSTTAHEAAQRWLRREKCFKLPIRLRRLWLLAMTCCSSTFVQWFCLSVLSLTQSSVLVAHYCYGRCFTASSMPLSNSSALSEARFVRWAKIFPRIPLVFLKTFRVPQLSTFERPGAVEKTLHLYLNGKLRRMAASASAALGAVDHRQHGLDH